MNQLKITVLDPTYPEAKDISKEDVFGKWMEDHTKVHDGMVTARSEEFCVHFGGVVPYKSVTVVCPDVLLEQVSYWLESNGTSGRRNTSLWPDARS